MTDPMTPEHLAEIEARANAATEGPWSTDPAYGHLSLAELFIAINGSTYAVRDADATFIAAARTDVPALLVEVRRLQAAVERVRELHVPDGEGFCRACDYGTQHPCPTITALDGDEQ